MGKMILMVGISGSGKSYLAKKLAKAFDFYVISSDAKREEWYGDANDQTHNKELFHKIEQLAKEKILSGENVIIDATNTNIKQRKRFVELGKKLNIDTYAVVVHVSPQIAEKRNLSRERIVPDYVIKRQCTNFEFPTKEEGFEDIFILKNDKPE